MTWEHYFIVYLWIMLGDIMWSMSASDVREAMGRYRFGVQLSWLTVMLAAPLIAFLAQLKYMKSLTSKK